MLRTLRNHLLQIRPVLQRRDRQRRAGAQQRARPRRSIAPSPPASIPPSRASAKRRSSDADDGAARRRCDAVAQPVRRRDPARAREPGARVAAHQRLPAAGAAGGVDQGRQRQGRRHGRRRGRCSRSTCTRASSKASTCAAARSRAAASAGATATTTSAPRSSGLMKTQMVKNAIIVPVGSKGGFVLKGQVPPRPALDAYLIDRYREFVSGPARRHRQPRATARSLHPPDVVRHDDDDPYLVVAADKGTAHLSDTANSVSAQYGFWLGDAFASGGSNGYDHKSEGHHGARRLGVRPAPLPQPRASTCRRSRSPAPASATWRATSSATACCAARRRGWSRPSTTSTSSSTPTPDPEKSFAERERLFALPRSTLARLRHGARSARAAASSSAPPRRSRSAREARTLLDIEEEAPSGEEVIRAHPDGEGRPALQRRHRHLRQGVERGGRRRRRPRQRPRPRRRARRCGPGSSARAATSA